MKDIEDKLAAFLMEYGVLKNADADKMAKKIAEMFEKERDELAARFPDIGPDPLKLDGEERKTRYSVEGSKAHLTKASCVQQTGIPDQTALVWRADLMKVCDDHTWRSVHLPALQEMTKQRDELAAKLDRVSRHVRCMYCNKEYSFDQSDQLADHIMSCEKSPVVDMVHKMEHRIMDYMDLMNDEFQRILAITDNQEIAGICERAQQVIAQKEPVIKQRDDALDKLRLSEAQVVQLLDENTSLKLDLSHSEAQNAQLAAKCAEMRDGFNKISGFSRCDIGCQQLCDYVNEVSEQCLSDDCGKGWLSPEKRRNLEAELESAKEVATWAQCLLTALNAGDCKSGSPLHLKLREVMISYRERNESKS